MTRGIVCQNNVRIIFHDRFQSNAGSKSNQIVTIDHRRGDRRGTKRTQSSTKKQRRATLIQRLVSGIIQGRNRVHDSHE